MDTNACETPRKTRWLGVSTFLLELLGQQAPCEAHFRLVQQLVDKKPIIEQLKRCSPVS
jgi:hypothetical protein